MNEDDCSSSKASQTRRFGETIIPSAIILPSGRYYDLKEIRWANEFNDETFLSIVRIVFSTAMNNSQLHLLEGNFSAITQKTSRENGVVALGSKAEL
jgi:hypothetical protein